MLHERLRSAIAVVVESLRQRFNYAFRGLPAPVPFPWVDQRDMEITMPSITLDGGTALRSCLCA
jgi:hypothetical protein